MIDPEKTPPWTKMLGKMTDAAVAKQFSLCLSVVRKKRWALGIKAHVPRRPKIKWTAEMDALLGKDTDKKVARELGLPVYSVYERRRYLRITSHGLLQRKKGKPTRKAR